MRGVKEILVSVALGVAFLNLFYRAVESHWPEAYFGGSAATHAVNSSPLRYLAFRFVPVYATCTFVAVTIHRLGKAVPAAVFGVVIGHMLLTTMRRLGPDARQTAEA